MEVGMKVKFVRDVERYPHFVAEEGRTGTITRLDDDQIVVKLDEPLDGAGEWDNEVHWYPDMYEETDFRRVFKSQTTPLKE